MIGTIQHLLNSGDASLVIACFLAFLYLIMMIIIHGKMSKNEKHKKKGKGRSQNQKLKLLYLLDYLLEETDETHTKKVQEIIDHFDNYHNFSPL